jgi:hypothetical protein
LAYTRGYKLYNKRLSEIDGQKSDRDLNNEA